MQYFNVVPAIYGRTILLAAALAAVSPAAHALPAGAAPAPAQATLESRISVHGFGRGYDGRELKGVMSRAVSLAEASGAPSGQHWSFVLQTGGDNRPVTLITAELQDGLHKPVGGSLRTASLGTAPPAVFAEELEVFARMLMSRARQQAS